MNLPAAFSGRNSFITEIGVRLLLVEDDEQLGQGIRKALMRDGDHVDWLTDSAQALTAIRSDSFELIILDLQLPGKDGISGLQTTNK
jgi:DNA-binding response OmpR family regulator